MSNLKKLEDRVSLIASKMTLREPFIAAVFTRLDRTFIEEGTAAVNGKRVIFGASFCNKLTDDELMFVALHEAMHVVLMHMWRREGRNPAMWNIANDAIINDTLIRMGYTMPQDGVRIGWVTEGMSSEDVYRRLMDEQQNQDGSGGSGQGEPTVDEDGVQHSGGGGWDGDGDLEDAENAADAADMEATIMTAARMAKACGQKGALIDRVLGGELAPTVSWTEALRHVLTSAARNDYTYRRFNRRLLSSGLYLPALYSDELGGLLIGVDTSGSVGPRELDQIAGEINAIVEDCRPEWVEVVYCDTSIKGKERFMQGDPVKLHPKGGGGTRFAPVFDYVAQMDERVAAVVFLTDLEGNTKECVDPGVPVVWAVTQRPRQDVPFGQVVEVRV